jgi:hypothetical protein
MYVEILIDVVTKLAVFNYTRKITIELDNAFNNDWDKNIHIVEFSTEDTSETGQVVTNYVFRLGLVIGCTQSLSRFYF